MTKSELIAEISNRTGQTKADQKARVILAPFTHRTQPADRCHHPGSGHQRRQGVGRCQAQGFGQGRCLSPSATRFVTRGARERSPCACGRRWCHPVTDRSAAR